MSKYTPEEALLRTIFTDESLPADELEAIAAEQQKALKEEAIKMAQKVKSLAKDLPDMVGVVFRAALLYENPAVAGLFKGEPHSFIIMGESLGRVPLDSYSLDNLIIV